MYTATPPQCVDTGDKTDVDKLNRWRDATDGKQRAAIDAKTNDDCKQASRGVSLGFLLRFAAFVKEREPKNFSRMKTSELVHGFGKLPRIEGDKVVYDADPAEYSIRGLTMKAASNMVDFFEMHGDSEDVQTLRDELDKFEPPEFRELSKARTTTRVKRESSVNSLDSEPPRSEADFGPSMTDGEDLSGSLEKFREIGWFGPADFFVSHAWGDKFELLVEALKNPSTSGSDTFSEHCKKRFWLDIFAVNQHYHADEEVNLRLNQEREADLNNFSRVIKNSREGAVLVLAPWDALVMQRSWCWLEITTALEENKKVLLALTPKMTNELRSVAYSYTRSREDLSRNEEHQINLCVKMLKNIDVERSDCLLSKDRKFIMERIESGLGKDLATKRVIGAVTSLLIGTADTLISKWQAQGTDKLYNNMLLNFTIDNREKANSLNNLVRIYHIMGRKTRSAQVCGEAIDIQRELIREAQVQKPSILQELEIELAVNLNSLGRVLGDRRDPARIEEALGYLDESLQLRRKNNHALIHESLYNIGRTYVLFLEKHKTSSAPFNDRVKKLREAQDFLEESRKLQEAIEKDEDRHLPSLGACYVFLGKVRDLLEDCEHESKNGSDPAQPPQQREVSRDSDEAFKFLIMGEEKQKVGFGSLDPRVFMTLLDQARHCARDLSWDPTTAWACYTKAHNGLMDQVKDYGGNPVSLLECKVEMLELMRKHDRYAATKHSSAEWKRHIDEGLQFVDWIVLSRPHLSDTNEVLALTRKIREYAIHKSGSKINLLLEQIRSNLSPALTMSMEDMFSCAPSGLADVIVSDAPYNRAIDTAWDEMGHQEFIAKIKRWARLMVRALAPEGIGFAFTDVTYASYWMHELRTARGAAPLHESSPDPAPEVLVESAIWYKPDAAWRRAFIDSNPQMKHAPTFDAPQVVRDCIEVVLIFRRSKASAVGFKDVVAELLAPDAANVWQLEKCKAPERLGGDAWHPAQKPLALMRALVRSAVDIAKRRKRSALQKSFENEDDSSGGGGGGGGGSSDDNNDKKDDEKKGTSFDKTLQDDVLVLEPFLGTGSAVVAAMLEGVQSAGCDLDSKWVEVVEQRILDVAKEKASA
ncbi:Methyltransferase [Hondaea fermentalgiana]|uniref:Methyltransferase n=1 Tax=Hondaea fermentalgiana TaxID=2315210 RepID=A0A2R5GFD7_9STRA|nr:Methyltransferase [Hondaea fermentalgiana]|eukprot:GBG29630.1 Methyltransferase [Hondaea fermentalgiana]